MNCHVFSGYHNTATSEVPPVCTTGQYSRTQDSLHTGRRQLPTCLHAPPGDRCHGYQNAYQHHCSKDNCLLVANDMYCCQQITIESITCYLWRCNNTQSHDNICIGIQCSRLLKSRAICESRIREPKLSSSPILWHIGYDSLLRFRGKLLHLSNNRYTLY